MSDSIDAARRHPEAIDISIAGQDFVFLLSMEGAMRARELDCDPVPSLIRFVGRLGPLAVKFWSSMGGSDGKKGAKISDDDDSYGIVMLLIDELPTILTHETIDDFLNVILWGLLQAHPDMTRADLYSMITPIELTRVFKRVWPKMRAYLSAADPDTDRAGDDSMPSKAEKKRQSQA